MGPEFLRATRLSPDSTSKSSSSLSSSFLSNMYNNAKSKITGGGSISESLSRCSSTKCVGFWTVAGLVLCLIVLRPTGFRLSLTDSASARDHLKHGFRLSYTDLGLQRSAACSMSNPCGFKVIADLDELSKIEDNKGKTEWISFILSGWLWDSGGGQYIVEWISPEKIVHGKYNEAGRGMELSELVRFDGKLLSFDDRTGIIFEILSDGSAVAKHIVTDGDGSEAKGMKIEWATTRDGELWIGSVGKEFTSGDGSAVISDNPFWVATMDRYGLIKHHNWKLNFEAMRKALNAQFPGYLIHEAVVWSRHMRKWVVMPRRVSKLPYDDIQDEKRGSNKMLICSEDFSKIEVVEVGCFANPRRGFSSVKFIPGTQDKVLAALKSEENTLTKSQLSYVTIFRIDGKVLVDDMVLPSKHKYEGIEFEETI